MKWLENEDLTLISRGNESSAALKKKILVYINLVCLSQKKDPTKTSAWIASLAVDKESSCLELFFNSLQSFKAGCFEEGIPWKNSFAMLFCHCCSLSLTSWYRRLQTPRKAVFTAFWDWYPLKFGLHYPPRKFKRGQTSKLSNSQIVQQTPVSVHNPTPQKHSADACLPHCSKAHFCILLAFNLFQCEVIGSFSKRRFWK